MVSRFVLVIVFVAGCAKCDDYYKQFGVEPRKFTVQPYGYYRVPGYPQQNRGHVGAWIPGSQGMEGEKKGIYYTGEGSDGDYYSGDILRKSVQEAQDSGLKATSGAAGRHAVSADTKEKQDYNGLWSDRGLQGATGAASGKVQEYGAGSRQAFDGSGKTGFKKGHDKSGFQKSYGNEESGEDSKFVDEDLKMGGETFVKSYGNKFGKSGKAGYGEVVNGFGYDHSSAGSGVAKSGLDSTGKHELSYNQHGHKGEYGNIDSLIGEKEAHSDHENHRKALGILDEVKSLHQKLFYHP